MVFPFFEHLFSILGKLPSLDVDKTAGFVKSCLNFDGGFGSRPGAESHAGILIQQSINEFSVKIRY